MLPPVQYRYVADPHPHLYFDELSEPSQYSQIVFPGDDVIDGTSSWGLTSTDSAYPEVVASPGWANLHGTFTSEPFVRQVVAAFGDDMAAAGCLVDPAKITVVPYAETRAEKQQAVLHTTGDPNRLFTRFDFQSKGAAQYRNFVHLDWARRIVGGILFFCDADEESLVGGELALYEDTEFADDRFCHAAQLMKVFRPRHNTGVLFLNSNGAFHGPRRIERLAGRRRWVYFAISSFVDVWPCRSRADVR